MAEETNTSASSLWLTVLAILAILWNLIGVGMVFLNANASPESLTAAGWTETQIDYILSTPLWAKFANGFAVLTGLLASIALLLRRHAAYYLYIVSLIAIMLVMIDAFVRNGFTILGGASNGLSIAVIVVAIFLFWTAHVAKASNTLK